MWAKRLLLVMVGMLVLGLCAGCEGDDDDSGGSGGGGSGNLGGTWTGTTAGRPLTMILNQNGTSMNGSYTLENPVFSEGLSGTASSETAPATASLTGGGDRHFEVTFNSSSSMSGGFFKGANQVGTVSASK